ncbi:MAG: histidine--tRNA ligase [Pseudomonadota bacterium]
MAKTKKTPRPKAETPKGFRDYFGADVVQRKEMLDKIAAVYHRYGFDALESSAVETVEALGKFLPDVDRPNEGVFAWQEDDADWLALRYDLTAPLARVYAQHRNDLPTPYRRYAMGPVWRNEKPGPGRFRQFYQCDADTVGTAAVAADAEICMMLADALDAVGLEGDYVIRVNNRKVLNGVLEVAGIAEDDERTRGIVLRAIDKLDRLGPEGVRALLGEGRKDESGDFTEGAGLDLITIETIMGFVDAKAQIAEIDNQSDEFLVDPEFEDLVKSYSDAAVQLVPGAKKNDIVFLNLLTCDYLSRVVEDSSLGRNGVKELLEIADYCVSQGYGPDRIVIDPSVVRGLGYYTGPVFEAELTFEITDEKGRPRQFGSVAGGGRYDDLVKRFTGQAVPAVGISIGVDRLLAALDAKGRLDHSAQGPVVVTVMDRDRMADYQAMASELRAAGIRAEVYLGNPKQWAKQLDYADARRAPVVIIQGSNEAGQNSVIVRDMRLGDVFREKYASEFGDTQLWRNAASRSPIQSKVKRDNLVRNVKRILRRIDRGYRVGPTGDILDDRQRTVMKLSF